jgi:hypothetical protein
VPGGEVPGVRGKAVKGRFLSSSAVYAKVEGKTEVGMSGVIQ